MRKVLNYTFIFLCIFFLGCSNIDNLEKQRFEEATKVGSLENSISNSQEVQDKNSGEIGEEIED